MRTGWYIFRSYRGGSPELWLSLPFRSKKSAMDRIADIHFHQAHYELHVAKIVKPQLVKVS